MNFDRLKLTGPGSAAFRVGVGLFFIFQIICLSPPWQQSKFTISGYIKDSLSSETLIGASLIVQGQTKGVNSNSYGFYSITLPQGKYRITCSFIGYQPEGNRN